MQNAIDDLKAEVARIPEFRAAMDAAFVGIKKQLADALDARGDQAAVVAIVKDLHDSIDGLAADVAANTP